jgi:hypothetical protein
MGDTDETAKLWKVNRTIHELVKDRVSSSEPTSCFANHDLITHSRRASWSLMMKLTWISSVSVTSMQIRAESLSEFCFASVGCTLSVR